jgi:amino acid transporter
MTKPPANRYRDSNNEADSEDEMENRFGLTSALIKVTNLTLFGVGSVLFIIGLLYLTVYRYEYSFTVFSIDMMAGISLALGAVLAFISLWAVLTMTAFGKPAGALLQAIFVFFAFVLLFILGVIGLSLNGNGELLTQNRNYMYYTAREFNEQVPYKHATKKFDWLQRKFLCCGKLRY